ncbi:ATP-binding protein [Myxococcaceae bacterium JPH2]|nr:ATP-binding protein [Myxococcaceae bacterium JPH2]
MADDGKASQGQGVPMARGGAMRASPVDEGPSPYGASRSAPRTSTATVSRPPFPPGAGGPRGEPARPPPPVQEAPPRANVRPPSARAPLVRPTPPDALQALQEVKVQAQEAARLDPELEKAVAFTHFDTAGSDDNHVTLLITREDVPKLASQSLVRIQSRADGRTYLGIVVRGPFAEPNAVPANSSMAVGVVTQGKKLDYTFDFHGRAEVEVLGEEVEGALEPPRFRPQPQSPVFLLDEAESARVLGVGGDLCLGRVVGYERMEARLNPRDKALFPRHTGILGTTGGGKSTTVATLIHRAQAAGIATIVFDVEGEYTHVDEPADHPAMKEALRRRGQTPEGVRDLHIHHVHGRKSRNPRHRNLHPFSLQFSRLSPYAVAEILDLSEAQLERFIRAYDVTKLLLGDFGIFPKPHDPKTLRQALELDEHTAGYPHMTLQHLLDVVSVYIHSLSAEGRAEGTSRARGSARKQGSLLDGLEADDAPAPEEDTPARAPGLVLYSEFRTASHKVMARVRAQPSRNEISWKALAGKLHRLHRVKLFDTGNSGVNYDALIQPGRVSIIDLSDTESPQLNNLVIADLLRGVQDAQEESYERSQAQDTPVTPVLLIIEEAHEFLSHSRVTTQMQNLFEQVANIAKRGRKRWLGLVFVTQLPQHLPDEVLGLINQFVIHKMTDIGVISRLKKTVGGIDESLWNRVSRLAPGQALVSFSSFTRPLLVAVDPAPMKRLLVD